MDTDGTTCILCDEPVSPYAKAHDPVRWCETSRKGGIAATVLSVVAICLSGLVLPDLVRCADELRSGASGRHSRHCCAKYVCRKCTNAFKRVDAIRKKFADASADHRTPTRAVRSPPIVPAFSAADTLATPERNALRGDPFMGAFDHAHLPAASGEGDRACRRQTPRHPVTATDLFFPPCDVNKLNVSDEQSNLGTDYFRRGDVHGLMVYILRTWPEALSCITGIVGTVFGFELDQLMRLAGSPFKLVDGSSAFTASDFDDDGDFGETRNADAEPTERETNHGRPQLIPDTTRGNAERGRQLVEYDDVRAWAFMETHAPNVTKAVKLAVRDTAETETRRIEALNVVTCLLCIRCRTQGVVPARRMTAVLVKRGVSSNALDALKGFGVTVGSRARPEVMRDLQAERADALKRHAAKYPSRSFTVDNLVGSYANAGSRVDVDTRRVLSNMWEGMSSIVTFHPSSDSEPLPISGIGSMHEGSYETKPRELLALVPEARDRVKACFLDAWYRILADYADGSVEKLVPCLQDERCKQGCVHCSKTLTLGYVALKNQCMRGMQVLLDAISLCNAQITGSEEGDVFGQLLQLIRGDIPDDFHEESDAFSVCSESDDEVIMSDTGCPEMDTSRDTMDVEASPVVSNDLPGTSHAESGAEEDDPGLTYVSPEAEDLLRRLKELSQAYNGASVNVYGDQLTRRMLGSCMWIRTKSKVPMTSFNQFNAFPSVFHFQMTLSQLIHDMHAGDNVYGAFARKHHRRVKRKNYNSTKEATKMMLAGAVQELVDYHTKTEAEADAAASSPKRRKRQDGSSATCRAADANELFEEWVWVDPDKEIRTVEHLASLIQDELKLRTDIVIRMQTIKAAHTTGETIDDSTLHDLERLRDRYAQVRDEVAKTREILFPANRHRTSLKRFLNMAVLERAQDQAIVDGRAGDSLLLWQAALPHLIIGGRNNYIIETVLVAIQNSDLINDEDRKRVVHEHLRRTAKGTHVPADRELELINATLKNIRRTAGSASDDAFSRMAFTTSALVEIDSAFEATQSTSRSTSHTDSQAWRGLISDARKIIRDAGCFDVHGGDNTDRLYCTAHTQAFTKKNVEDRLRGHVILTSARQRTLEAGVPKSTGDEVTDDA